MLKHLIYIVFLLIAHSPILYSKTIIKGTVKNIEGEPMANVMVTIQNANSGTIAGGVATESSGNYCLSFDQVADSILVTVRGLTIEKSTRKLPNHSAIVDFVVDLKTAKLKEISIKANPINRKNDTLSYLVGTFKGQNDRTIEDVLKNLPGIDVSSSGKISYNGKSISKFYIEGLDMLGGRYSTATKNLAAEDVASVQIYESRKYFFRSSGSKLKTERQSKRYLGNANVSRIRL